MSILGRFFGRADPPPVEAATDERLTIILEEARRALDRQHADLNSLRDRAGNLLQFGAIAAAFLGGLTLRGKAPLTEWTYAGAAAFVALAVLTVSVLWLRTFTFANNAVTMLDDWSLDDPDGDGNYVTEHLARHLQNHYNTNYDEIKWMARFYLAAICALVLEVVFLFVDLMRR